MEIWGFAISFATSSLETDLNMHVYM